MKTIVLKPTPEGIQKILETYLAHRQDMVDHVDRAGRLKNYFAFLEVVCWYRADTFPVDQSKAYAKLKELMAKAQAICEKSGI